ncbi:MAG: hypothetical protein RSC92_01745 [Clostridia bacterium]
MFITRKNTIVNLESDIETLKCNLIKSLEVEKEKDTIILNLTNQIDLLNLKVKKLEENIDFKNKQIEKYKELNKKIKEATVNTTTKSKTKKTAESK